MVGAPDRCPVAIKNKAACAIGHADIGEICCDRAAGPSRAEGVVCPKMSGGNPRFPGQRKACPEYPSGIVPLREQGGGTGRHKQEDGEFFHGDMAN